MSKRYVNVKIPTTAKFSKSAIFWGIISKCHKALDIIQKFIDAYNSIIHNDI